MLFSGRLKSCSLGRRFPTRSGEYRDSPSSMSSRINLPDCCSPTFRPIVLGSIALAEKMTDLGPEDPEAFACGQQFRVQLDQKPLEVSRVLHLGLRSRFGRSAKPPGLLRRSRPLGSRARHTDLARDHLCH